MDDDRPPTALLPLVNGLAVNGAPEGTRTPNLLTLLCLSRSTCRCHGSVELPVELAGDVALQAAADLS
jgi:hypothetical protein